MNVNDPNLSGLSNAGLGGASGASGARPVDNQKSTSGAGRRADRSTDLVQLSDLSRQLRASDLDSPERLAQLDKVRADVQSGRYQPDPVTIAQAVVRNALGEST
jgi:hypothetical protein